MKTYLIKEIFYSIQGEGCHAGRPAVFVRFAGCNLWNGIEEDRGLWFKNKKSPCAMFCDTDFVKGTKMTSQEIAAEVKRLGGRCKFIVLTGGEPTLQVDRELTLTLYDREGYNLSMETNGTNPFGEDLEVWVTLSPKIPDINIKRVDELKVIFPTIDPIIYERILWDRHMEGGICGSFFEAKDHKFVQPEDGPNLKKNTQKCLDFILDHPDWRLSLQTHKMVGMR